MRVVSYCFFTIFAQVFLMALPDTCNFAVPLNYALVAVPLFEVK